MSACTCVCVPHKTRAIMCVLAARPLSLVHLNKVFLVNSIPQPTCYYGADRFITSCLNDISQLFLGFVGIKVHFEDPDYVISSLCPQAFDTDKRMVAAEADEPR